MSVDYFYSTPKICFGKGAVKYLRTLPHISRVCIVSDEEIIKAGYVDIIVGILNSRPSDCKIKIVSDIDMDPSSECFKRGVVQIQQYEPDTIIAIGGGTAINAAKGMWLFYENPDIKYEELKGKLNVTKENSMTVPKIAQKAKFITIAATSGPVSEAASFVIVTKRGYKHVRDIIVDYDMTPDYVIVDPQLVANMPKSVVASTGYDMLSLAIETYVSRFASDYTDGLALKAIELVFNYLQRSYNDPLDETAKAKVHNASCIASMAYSNTYSGICNALTTAIGEEYEVAHGVSNAILLPYVIEYNAVDYEFPELHTDRKYAEIAKHIGLGGNTIAEQISNLMKALKTLAANLDICSSFADCVTFFGGRIDKEKYLASIPDIALRAYEDPAIFLSPKRPQLAHLEEILRKAYAGPGL
jgi:acetaldehyde dehydrogenase / alcohol dehydrogenase